MDLVGLSEVAEIAGVSRQAVVNWRARFPDFPIPAAELASGPVWTRDEIEKWLKRREESAKETIADKNVDSGKMQTRSLNLTDFDRVDVGSAIQAKITRSEVYYIKVDASDYMFNYLDISKSGTALRVRLRSLFWHHWTKVTVLIGMPELRAIKASGASNISIEGFNSENPLNVESSGASGIKVKDVNAGETRFVITGASNIIGNISFTDGHLQASGASEIELSGHGGNIHMELSGSSIAHLAEFKATYAEVKMSGASRGSVNLNGKLDANLSGASRLSYTGEFKMGKLQLTGASSLQQR